VCLSVTDGADQLAVFEGQLSLSHRPELCIAAGPSCQHLVPVDIVLSFLPSEHILGSGSAPGSPSTGHKHGVHPLKAGRERGHRETLHCEEI
jgi:hypothetical protein